MNLGNAALTIDPNASETINGQATIALQPGMTANILRLGGAQWVASIYGHGRLIGEYVQVAGPNLPPFCVWPNGQNLSRSAYATLFAAIGTTYGAGDGSTSFGTPDVRGRGLFALDNLGGAAASRITSGVSGINAAALGAAGGDQRIGTHGHAATQEAQIHGLSDPGHQHWSGVNNGGGGDYYGASSPANRTNNTSARYSLLGGLTSDTSHLTSFSPTGITIANATPPITVSDFAGGASANMPPALICTVALFAGA
ncbi:MAG: tail fiber protein [Roseomonas sp.]|nr:tail fiber protein [Roseomonas sp.]